MPVARIAGGECELKRLVRRRQRLGFACWLSSSDSALDGFRISVEDWTFWQPFLPSLGVLGRDNCSPANFAQGKTACFDLATNRGQTDCVLTRELIQRVGLLKKNGLHGDAPLSGLRRLLSALAGFRIRLGARIDRFRSVPAWTKAVPSALFDRYREAYRRVAQSRICTTV